MSGLMTPLSGFLDRCRRVEADTELYLSGVHLQFLNNLGKQIFNILL